MAAKDLGKIIICRADQLVRKVAEFKPAAVLSIEHPGAKPGDHGAVPRLGCGTPQKILTFWDSEHGAENGPDVDQVEAGILFIAEHLRRGGDVIVHCHAGVSRSTALALGALSLLHPRKSAPELVEMLLAIRPQSGPNIVAVELADRLTSRNGTLLAAVRDNRQIAQKRAMAERGRRQWLAKNPETYRRMHPEKFPPPPKP